MAMASGLYVVTFEGSMGTENLTVDMDLSTNKVILVTDTHTPDFQTDNDYNDIDNEVAAGGGYTQNSKTVGGTPTYGWASTNRLKYTWSAAVVWSSSTITARGMIVTTSVATCSEGKSGGKLCCSAIDLNAS